MFFDRKLAESSDFFSLEPSLYPSLTDIVEAMNTLIQEQHNRNESFKTAKVSRRVEKAEIDFANEAFGLSFFSTDSGHIFGKDIDLEFGVVLREKRPHKQKYAHHIVSIHLLMLYTDLIQYNIVRYTKAPFCDALPSFQRKKPGTL